MRATPLQIESETHRMLKDAQMSRTRPGRPLIAITDDQRIERHKRLNDQSNTN